MELTECEKDCIIIAVEDRIDEWIKKRIGDLYINISEARQLIQMGYPFHIINVFQADAPLSFSFSTVHQRRKEEELYKLIKSSDKMVEEDQLFHYAVDHYLSKVDWREEKVRKDKRNNSSEY